MLVLGGIRIGLLVQARFIPQLTEDLGLHQAVTHLRGLFERLAHSSQLLKRLVHFNAFLFDLLPPLHQLVLLRSDALSLTGQFRLHLLQITLLMLDLFVLILDLLLDLVDGDHFLAKSSVLLNDVVLQVSELLHHRVLVLVLQLVQELHVCFDALALSVAVVVAVLLGLLVIIVPHRHLMRLLLVAEVVLTIGLTLVIAIFITVIVVVVGILVIV